MIQHLATGFSRDVLTRLLWISITLAGLLIGGLGIRIAIASRTTSGLNAESSRLEKQLQESAGQPTGAEGGVSPPHGLATLGVLQQSITQAAESNDCQLTEFKAGTDVAPYGPHYRKRMPEGQWSQMDAHFTLAGRLRNVIETLRSLNGLKLPTEIDTINLVRDSILADGAAHINVQVHLRAISQGAAS